MTPTVGSIRSLARRTVPDILSSGCLRPEVPDGNDPDSSYIEHVRPGACGDAAAADADGHNVLYTHSPISRMLAASRIVDRFCK